MTVRLALLGGALAQAVLVTALSPGAAPQRSQPADPIAFMGSFIREMFPEMRQKELEVQVSTRMYNGHGTSYFEVSMGKPKGCCMGGVIGSIFPHDKFEKSSPPPPIKEPPRFGGAFQFRNNHLWQFTGSISSVHDHTAQVYALAEKNTQWSDQKLIDTLRQAGAKFGPWNRQGFLEQIRHQPLERFLGHFTIRQVRFELLSHQQNAPNLIQLYWSVEASSPTGRRYSLLYEPFEGELFAISVLSARPAGQH